ncbi:hypothetical protein BC835DRAFT_1526547 [Cytidiella melzeri]|nr:hypothetical protein BC835DRAFT_1526547 [Cytidiella melzeri]
MRYPIAIFTIVLSTVQLVAAVPATLPMVYGGLVSRDLRTDRFNRITLAPGYRSASRNGRVSSPNAPNANGANVNQTVVNGTITNTGGSGNGGNGGTSTSQNVPGKR